MVAARREGRRMFELSRYIPYLVRRTSARVDEIIRPELAAAGLTLEMWRVVVSIHVHGPQSLGDLSRRTSVNLSTLSRLVGAMERAKLVRRQRVVGNGRTVKIDLLPLGRRRCRGFLPFALALERRITRRFSAAELRVLRALLGRLYAAVNEDAAPVKAPRKA
jgi:DNA-binding MarR family transcriptional regulator